MRRKFALLLAGFLFLAPAWLHASTYYVDARDGSDSNPGTSPVAAWKTLERANRSRFQPSDSILLRSGSRWQGHLVLTASGTEDAPIRVDRYGSGPLPRIDGNGYVENVVELVNVQYVEVRHLEITNHGQPLAVRRGVLIAADNYGTAPRRERNGRAQG
jgi:hypothetical protein